MAGPGGTTGDMEGRQAAPDENIDSILTEDRRFQPPAGFSSGARVRSLAEYQALRDAADRDPVAFWAGLARAELHWHKPFTTAFDDSRAPYYTWFGGGLLNVSYNCLDRHLAGNAEKTAILFEGEPGDVRHISYAELHRQVCRFANALKARGIGLGDRVVIYMPMVPEAVVAMLACARIGAIHSVVFGGFSSGSLRNRIEDASARAVVTADGGHRGGKVIELKAACDVALSEGCKSVETVIVLRRTGNPISMRPGRDLWWDEAEANLADQCEPVWVDSEHPLFLLYTSGSTGKPKGIQHSSAGYLAVVAATMKWVFDIRDSDIFWCTADIGWVTGHSYIAYGPLASGATVLIYEGTPTVPDAGRFWSNCARHRVTIFYTAPTAIRSLMKFGESFAARYDLASLRLLGTVGEPINPEAWMWFHRVIGHERCPIVDTWWQTETGAIMIAPVPGAITTKPGSCTLPLPGIDADIVDAEGNSITDPGHGGELVIRKPWPSMLRAVWGNDKRYRDTYWGKFGDHCYIAGDTAHRDRDGYFWILGRSDDVLKVSGHRLGTMEIESALAAHPRVAEAAVVGKPDETKGETIFAFVVPRGARPTPDAAGELSSELRAWVAQQIGPIAKPEHIRYADSLPKTRSGKIMRRLLRDIARGVPITQDTSTLENEEIVKQLQGES